MQHFCPLYMFDIWDYGYLYNAEYRCAVHKIQGTILLCQNCCDNAVLFYGTALKFLTALIF